MQQKHQMVKYGVDRTFVRSLFVNPVRERSTAVLLSDIIWYLEWWVINCSKSVYLILLRRVFP